MTLPDLRAAASGELALRLSPRYLDEHCLLPLGIGDDGALITAVGRALDPTVTDELSRVFRRPLRLVQHPAAEIQAAVLAARRVDADATQVAITDDASPSGSAAPLDDLRALATQAPVIKLVNVLILDALKANASDVHLEAAADGIRVRYRLDGVLSDVSRPPRQYQQALVSRVKIMAGLDVAERRVPQDGRVRLTLAERNVDLRVSTLPALHGESVVLRILDHGDAPRDLAELGMPDAMQARFERLVARSSGIVLVTGPTGSGKTTTLYAALARVNGPGVKVVTVEDPVEYQMEGVTQIPVNRKAGVSFASALRSILRHDPDIIMVGEMRDRETAEIAIQAALTGHRVFSTLHTNDAVSGVTRLVDMGIEPYLVAATVAGIVAQRLVRVVCSVCGASESGRRMADGGTAVPPPSAIRLPPSACAHCSGTGFRGRTGIYELFTLDEQIRRLVSERATLDALRSAAKARAMATLRDDGMAKVSAGVTTIEEVLRVTSDEDPCMTAVDTQAERFRYRASDADGRMVEGVVQAPTRVIALEELRRQRLVPVDCVPLGADVAGGAPRQRRAQALATWARTVATLLEAGVPLDRALGFASTHSGHPAVASASSQVRAEVQGGSTLADALRKRIPVFGALIPAMAAAGEESGALDQAMVRLAEHLDEANDLRAQVRSALVYPAIMAGASAAGITVLLAFVVPRFAAMLQETGGSLPLSTRTLVGMSRVVTGWWWLWLLLILGTVVSARAWLGDGSNRRRYHAARLRWPVVGSIETSFSTARFTRALGLLLGSGMPVLSALRIARGTVSNLALGAALDRAAEDVSHGVRIATALTPVLPPLGAQLLAVGEETGRLPDLARQVAETYDRELKRALRSAVALIEPALILFFAVLVGFVALAMLQAIYSINAGTAVASNITSAWSGA